MSPDNLPRGTSPPPGGLAATDLADWLTIDVAAARIGCSKRTMERRAREWGIEMRLRPQAGSRAIAVYNPDDVAQKAQDEHPAPAPWVLPAGVTSPVTSGNGNGHRGLQTGIKNIPGDDPIRHLAAAFERFLLSPPTPPVAEKVAESANPFLTLAEAAAFRHVSERLVLRWMRTEKLDFEREPRSQWTAEDRGWRIRRKDLEAL